jgi:hypothetical protein
MKNSLQIILYKVNHETDPLRMVSYNVLGIHEAPYYLHIG